MCQLFTSTDMVPCEGWWDREIAHETGEQVCDAVPLMEDELAAAQERLGIAQVEVVRKRIQVH